MRADGDTGTDAEQVDERRPGRPRRGLVGAGLVAAGLVVGALVVGVVRGDDLDTGTDVPGPSSDGDGPGTLERLGGQTQQGRRIVLDPLDGRRVSIRLTMVCDKGGRISDVWYGEHTFEAGVSDEGRFSVERSFVEEGTDGDEDRISVRIDGDLDSDRSADGTARAQVLHHNGQANGVDRTCDTDRVGWSASPVPSPPVVASTDVDQVASLRSSEDGVWAITSDARALRLAGGDPAVPELTTADPIFDPSTWGQDANVVGGAIWSHIASGNLSGTIARTQLGSGAYEWVPKNVVDLASGNGALWAVTMGSGGLASSRLERLDARTGAEEATAPSIHGRMAVGSDAVWVVSDPNMPGAGPATVQGYDPDTLEVVSTFRLRTDETAYRVVWSPDGLWLILEDGLLHVDTRTGEETPFDLEADAVVADGTGAWVATSQERVLRRLEGGEVVRVIDLGGSPDDLATSGDGTLWVADRGAGTVLQLRP